MSTLIIKQDGVTGSYKVIGGDIDPNKKYELHNGRFFGLNSMVWVDEFTPLSKVNGCKTLILTGQQIIDY